LILKGYMQVMVFDKNLQFGINVLRIINLNEERFYRRGERYVYQRPGGMIIGGFVLWTGLHQLDMGWLG